MSRIGLIALVSIIAVIAGLHLYEMTYGQAWASLIASTAFSVLAILAVSMIAAVPFFFLRSRSVRAFGTATFAFAGLLTAIVALGALA